MEFKHWHFQLITRLVCMKNRNLAQKIHYAIFRECIPDKEILERFIDIYLSKPNFEKESEKYLKVLMEKDSSIVSVFRMIDDTVKVTIDDLVEQIKG